MKVINTIKNVFSKLLNNILLKFKNFFSKANLKKHIIGFSIATVLLVIDIIVAYKLGYKTEHKHIYEATPYVILLVISYLLYLIKLFLTNKKSSTDIIIILYIFVLFWDISYKVGLVQNDLLIQLNSPLLSK